MHDEYHIQSFTDRTTLWITDMAWAQLGDAKELIFSTEESPALEACHKTQNLYVGGYHNYGHTAVVHNRQESVDTDRSCRGIALKFVGIISSLLASLP